MARVELPIKNRTSTYSLLVGVVVGMLVAGLLVPLAFGESVTSNTTDRADTPGVASADAPEATPDARATSDDAAPTRDLASPSDVRRDALATGDSSQLTAPASPAGGAAAAASDPAAELTASDRGVTADSIKLGVLLLDVGNLSNIGIAVPGVDPEQQRAAWEIYIDRQNEAGGILGRTIEPVYQKYDVLSNDSMRNACLALTKDAKVFAVIDPGGVFGPPILCFTEEHRTPLIFLGTQGVPKGFYARSDGLLFSTFAAGVRIMQNLMLFLEEDGHLKGGTFGIVSDNRGDPGGHTVEAGATATLEALGYEVKHWTHLSEDTSTASSQIPLEVQQQRTSGVDTVFLLTSTLQAQQWVQEADSQQWRPNYFVSDWATGFSDVYAQNMPESFEGSLVLTGTRNNDWRIGNPEPDFDRQCRETYEDGSGEELPRDQLTYQVTLRICSLFKLFVWSSTDAGTELTRTRLSSAMQQLGEVPLATMGGGSFRRGKFDAAELFRYMTWQADCRCWIPSSQFRNARA